MRTLLKELRLRLFTLRVLIAIHANKATLAASKTFSKAKVALVPRMRKTTWLAWSQDLLPALSKALRTAGSLLKRVLFSFLFSFLLPLLAKAARASLIFLFQHCRKLWHKLWRQLWHRYPRTLVGGATLALALFSLNLALSPPLAPPPRRQRRRKKYSRNQPKNQPRN